eukprot:Gb_29105 [translate_table: standard]
MEQQKVAAKIAEFLKPGISLKAVKEGTEPAAFWNALGGRQSYESQREGPVAGGDPHLYACTFEKGTLKLIEVFNFTQDDLLTEDIMILNTHNEVFVWIGQHVDAKLKQQAFEIGQKYMEQAALLEGLSLDTPLYRVTEGNEPSFFTRLFAWDSGKAVVQGNSFEKKLVILQGLPLQTVEKLKNRVHKNDAGSTESTKQVSESSNGRRRGGSTQRAAALAALSSAFNSSRNGEKSATKADNRAFRPALNHSSQKAAAVAALSTALSVEPKPPAPAALVSDEKLSITVSEKIETNISVSTETELLPKQEKSATENGIKAEDSVPDSNGQEVSKEDETKLEENEISSNYSYERLKSKSTNPAPRIDPKRREAYFFRILSYESYLTPEEFQKIFKMDQKKFYEQPKWKQDRQKKAADLF